ncbi:MAG: hypothetical protein AAB354_00340 [candidate division KSB1 bacterium]
MDRRSQASLTYRIITEVLALVMIVAALVTGLVTQWSFARLAQGVVLNLALFSFITMVWWQLSSMYGMGVFRGPVSNVLGMFLAFNLTLMPLWLGIVLTAGPETSLFMHALFPASFALSGVILAVLIRLGQVYQSKHQWRLVHHSLWITSALLLATAFIPASLSFKGVVSLQTLAWLVIFFVPLAVRRLGVSLVANPARPPAPRPASSGSNAHASSNSNSPASDSNRNHPSSVPTEEAAQGENRERRYNNRRGGQYRRRQGGGRRRM